MSFRLRVTPAADRDADEIGGYILRDNFEQAAKFYDALDATYRHITLRPHAWRPVMLLNNPRADGLRYRPVLGFPNHLVLFRIADEYVDVVRILHAARDLPAVLLQELGPEPE